MGCVAGGEYTYIIASGKNVSPFAQSQGGQAIYVFIYLSIYLFNLIGKNPSTEDTLLAY